MTERKFIKGVSEELGGETYIIPPLNFASLQELETDITAMGNIGSLPTKDQMTSVSRIVCAAMKRNYPDMTPEKVSELLDLDNIKRVLPAILGSSGVRKSVGEGQAEAAPTSASTGEQPTA